MNVIKKIISLIFQRATFSPQNRLQIKIAYRKCYARETLYPMLIRDLHIWRKTLTIDVIKISGKRWKEPSRHALECVENTSLGIWLHTVRGDSSCIKHFSRHFFSKGLLLHCDNTLKMNITVERYKIPMATRRQLHEPLKKRQLTKGSSSQDYAAHVWELWDSRLYPGTQMQIYTCPSTKVSGRNMAQQPLMWSLTLQNLATRS